MTRKPSPRAAGSGARTGTARPHSGAGDVVHPAPRNERVRVHASLIRRRLSSGRGATGQPNATGDGEGALTPAFWGMVVLTGIAAGLLGDGWMSRRWRGRVPPDRGQPAPVEAALRRTCRGHPRRSRMLYRLRGGHVRALLAEALFHAEHQVSGVPTHD